MKIEVLKKITDVSKVEKLYRIYVQVVDNEDYPTCKIFENAESEEEEVLNTVRIGKEHKYEGELVEELSLFGVVRRTLQVPDEMFTDTMEEIVEVKEAVIEMYNRVIGVIREVLKEGGYKELTIHEEVYDVQEDE